MPLEIKEGTSIPIPCRNCGKAFIPFCVREGSHSLTCKSCRSGTRVRVNRRNQTWEIRTQAE